VMVRFFLFPKTERVVFLSIHEGISEMAADLALARVLSLLLLFALLSFCADCEGVTNGKLLLSGFSEVDFSEGGDGWAGSVAFSEGRDGCAGSVADDKSSKVRAATSASVCSAFLAFHLAIRAYIAERLHVMPPFNATVRGTP